MNNVFKYKKITLQEAINSIIKFKGNMELASAYLEVPEKQLKNKLIDAGMWRYKNK